MNPSFNLLTEKWIPYVGLDGLRGEYNLWDILLHADQIAEIEAPSPITVASLYRFMLAVVYAIYKPRNLEQWQQIWQGEKFSLTKLVNYFDRKGIHERFDLFHKAYPFYQITLTMGNRLSSLSALILEKASGNNPTLFDHTQDQTPIFLDLAEVARAVITIQNFAIGGGNSGLHGHNFRDGICARGLSCFVGGKNLFETLLLNLVPYNSQRLASNLADDFGKPIWEQDSPFADERTIPDSFLDYLTWPSRRLRLTYENGELVIYRTQGLDLNRTSIDFDPFMPYRKSDKEGYILVRLTKEKALWRDSAALFRVSKNDSKPPEVIDWLITLARRGIIPKWAKYRLLVFGVATNPKSTADIYFSRGERFPFPVEYTIDEDLPAFLSDALQLSEDVAYGLRQSLWTSGLFLFGSDSEIQKKTANHETERQVQNWVTHTEGESYFWANLEIPFYKFMEDLPSKKEESTLGWRTLLRETAKDAYYQATKSAGTSPRVYRAIVRGEEQLNCHLARLIPYQKEKQPHDYK